MAKRQAGVIVNETVFVIYKDRSPLTDRSSRLVYTDEGVAKGQITRLAKEDAEQTFELGGHDWYDLSFDEKEDLTQKARNAYAIVKYKPVL